MKIFYWMINYFLFLSCQIISYGSEVTLFPTVLPNLIEYFPIIRMVIRTLKNNFDLPNTL